MIPIEGVEMAQRGSLEVLMQRIILKSWSIRGVSRSWITGVSSVEIEVALKENDSTDFQTNITLLSALMNESNVLTIIN